MRNDQRAAQARACAMPAPNGASPSASADHIWASLACSAGTRPNRTPVSRRRRQREGEDAPVNAEVEAEREEQIALRQQAAQPVRQPRADEQPGRAAGKRERQALGEQLPDDPDAAGAESEPRCDLFLRAAARASSSPATFAHAISSTIATAANGR